MKLLRNLFSGRKRASSTKEHPEQTFSLRNSLSRNSGFSDASCESVAETKIATAHSFFTLTVENEFQELEKICTTNCDVYITRTGTVFKLKDLILILIKKFQSFPDMDFTVFHSSYIKSQNKVQLEIQASGTHTGKPYGFDRFPEIPATGIKCQNDIETVTFSFNQQNLISKVSVDCETDLTGPAGFYVQIGGLVL